ncbi:MAG: metallophosphoesterase [Candidatus Bipolaricaulia bacterium]
MKPEKVKRLGIIADSHDHLDLLGEAVDLFERENVDLVLHAGDFMSPLTADPLSNLQANLVGVFGNNDGDKLFLRRRFEEEGVGRIERGPHRLELGERTVLLMHEPRLLEVMDSSPVPDLIVYGHTHEVDVKEGQPLVVNPGEIGGWLTGRSTVGLVDLEEMEAEIREITD